MRWAKCHQLAQDYRDTEYQGYVNPKMYKRPQAVADTVDSSRIMPDKKAISRARRTKKRAWRKLPGSQMRTEQVSTRSNRLQKEWKFRRYPRDESGKAEN